MTPVSPGDTVPRSHAAETAAGERFAFGSNWARFLATLNEDRIRAAEESLCRMLGVTSLAGMRFLDAGSGSGLFSLAARRLGADVVSFDFDPRSVACTTELRRRFAKSRDVPEDDRWLVAEGSVLDRTYVESLGRFDIVYSWGVLHHTGHQWVGLDLLSARVSPGGRLFVALYNDQGLVSRWWTMVKRVYNRSALGRIAVIVAYLPYFIGLRWLYRRLFGLGPLERGMSLWHDMIDWLGGYPFEASRPEAVFRFLRARGFELRELVTAGSTGACNEFVFERVEPLRGVRPFVAREGSRAPQRRH